MTLWGRRPSATSSPSGGVFDVSGAGDTVIAMLAAPNRGFDAERLLRRPTEAATVITRRGTYAFIRDYLSLSIADALPLYLRCEVDAAVWQVRAW